MAKTGRGPARVCGPCYLDIRPGEYEPFTFIDGECVQCGQLTYVHRVSWAEVMAFRSGVTLAEQRKAAVAAFLAPRPA